MWILWLLAAAVFGVGEMHQGGFYLLPFAFGAALAAVVSLLGVGAGLSAVLFVATSAVLFGALRPVAKRHPRLPPPLPTGAAALVPRRGMGRQPIANRPGLGRRRLA